MASFKIYRQYDGMYCGPACGWCGRNYTMERLCLKSRINREGV